jgi:hypothetical protein
MATLSDEHLRALRFLAQHRGGCAEVVLLAQGFTTAQLGHLVFAGLAKIRGVAGRPKFLVKITAAGRRTIAGLPELLGEGRARVNGEPDAMADLTDEQLRALRLLARYPSKCPGTVLLEQGFSYDQLSDLVLDGLAKLEPSITREGGVVWAAITAAGRKTIAE